MENKRVIYLLKRTDTGEYKLPGFGWGPRSEAYRWDDGFPTHLAVIASWKVDGVPVVAVKLVPRLTKEEVAALRHAYEVEDTREMPSAMWETQCALVKRGYIYQSETKNYYWHVLTPKGLKALRKYVPTI